jgi:hypothetical protein
LQRASLVHATSPSPAPFHTYYHNAMQPSVILFMAGRLKTYHRHQSFTTHDKPYQVCTSWWFYCIPIFKNLVESLTGKANQRKLDEVLLELQFKQVF